MIQDYAGLRGGRLCAWLAVALILFLATPRPTFRQYFVLATPFLTILGAAGLTAIGAKWLTVRGAMALAVLDDLIVIGKSVLAGAVVSAGVVFLMYRFQGPSRAVFILDALLLFIFVSAARLSFRLMRMLLVDRNHKSHPDARPVFIYGAGDSGEILVRMILNNPDHRYMPVAFIDDDAGKAGKILHGCRIFDSRELPDLIRRHGVSEVLVSSSKVSENRLEGLRSMGVFPRRMSVHIE